jgi:hypothetical protein
MLNRPTLPQTSFPVGQGEIGVPFTVTLLLSMVAVGASISWPYILSPSNLTNAEGALVERAALLALLLGSAIALVLAVAAARHLLQGRWRRSWKSSALLATAALSALPGLWIGSLLVSAFTYSLLPLTASELRAIDVAEKFVERNGYTSAGHPNDLPVLPNDIMDSLAGSEERLLEMRKGTLEARAFGVRSVGSGFRVFFESIPPRTSGAYRTLEVDEEGHARMLHQDMSSWWPKKAER